jgi:UrcA family protein
MTMRKTILVTAALVAAFACAQAPAQTAPARLSISYADLDLSRPADRARLNRRIANAMETVCGSYADAPPYQEREIARCRAGARTNVDVQLAALQTRRDRMALVVTGTR